MATSTPPCIPSPWDKNEKLEDAYRRGWDHGHGIACHNVPSIGAKLWLESLGKVTVDAENVREVHAYLCSEAESNSRCYSPFEFTAAEFNRADDEDEDEGESEEDDEDEASSEELWEAFEDGTTAAINADLSEYDDADYGIEDEDEGESEDEDEEG